MGCEVMEGVFGAPIWECGGWWGCNGGHGDPAGWEGGSLQPTVDALYGVRVTSSSSHPLLPPLLRFFSAFVWCCGVWWGCNGECGDPSGWGGGSLQPEDGV